MSRLPEVPEEARLATQLADAIARLSALEAYELGGEREIIVTWRDGGAKNNNTSYVELSRAIEIWLANNLFDIHTEIMAFARGDVTKARDALRDYYAGAPSTRDGGGLSATEFLADCHPITSSPAEQEAAARKWGETCYALGLSRDNDGYTDVSLLAAYQEGWDAARAAAGFGDLAKPGDGGLHQLIDQASADALVEIADDIATLADVQTSAETETSSEIDTFVDAAIAQKAAPAEAVAPDAPVKEDEPVV